MGRKSDEKCGDSWESWAMICFTPSHWPSGWICKVLKDLGRHQLVLAWEKERWRRCRNGVFCCVLDQSEVLQLFLFIFTCTANKAFAWSGAAINLCRMCFCSLQNLKLPFSYHSVQVHSILALFYEMGCQGVYQGNYFIVLITLKSCTWNIQKVQKYFASTVITTSV